MTLLFITQKLHGQDAFTIQWIEAWRRRGYEVTVLCLEFQPRAAEASLGRPLPVSLSIRSLGKEHGASRFMQIVRFLWYVSTLRYDRVFIHMTPVWGAVGAPVWLIRRTPVYLWYTHYKMQLGLWLLGKYGKRLFAATRQSLPQYEGSPKKIVVGHGVDLSYWPRRENTAPNPHSLLVVHRLARSKRLELVLDALALLPASYTLDVYGIEAEPEYVVHLLRYTRTLGIQDRVQFHGTVPFHTLSGLYVGHRLILNMASETIDKTMLEAMTCGCYPVTTARNAEAIGLPAAPSTENPQEIAASIQYYTDHPPASGEELYEIVRSRHSLDDIVEKMDRFVHAGQ